VCKRGKGKKERNDTRASTLANRTEQNNRKSLNYG